MKLHHPIIDHEVNSTTAIMEVRDTIGYLNSDQIIDRVDLKQHLRQIYFDQLDVNIFVILNDISVEITE
ncbi:hypothetical protein GJ496_007088 [Pomphorhynchus laevis]|nr:hypothetical protein GJ496_007088 [Pomphorhynchus laevis]